MTQSTKGLSYEGGGFRSVTHFMATMNAVF